MESASGQVSRWRAVGAGMVAAAVAIGTAEIAHAIDRGAPSLVLAIGHAIVNGAPSGFVRVAIRNAGTADKPALLAGIVVVAVVLGGIAGSAARNRFWVGPAAMAGAGLMAVAAEAGRPGGHVFTALVVAGVGVAAGSAALRWLLRLATPTRSEEQPVATALSRRRFLVAAGSLAAVAAVPLVVSRLAGRGLRAAASRARVVLPRPQRPLTPPDPGASFVELPPVVTPNADFYRIDTALAVPDVDAADWRLTVRGMVKRPFTVTYDELLAMPMIEEYVTLTCVSNEVGGPLIGNARWLGVPLADLLERAGVRDGATQIIGRSVDGFTAGFPTAVGLDGRTALVAVGMNGEPLPVAHGFPARLVVAGLYGYVSATKWLSAIELTTLEAEDGYWVPRGWSKEAPIKTQSRIDVPRPGTRLPAGLVVVAGVAWAQTRGVNAVEVQVDDGDWQPAALAAPLSVNSWLQWRYEWDAGPGRHRVRVRATDGTGERQDATSRTPDPDGATGYDFIMVDVAT